MFKGRSSHYEEKFLPRKNEGQEGHRCLGLIWKRKMVSNDIWLRKLASIAQIFLVKWLIIFHRFNNLGVKEMAIKKTFKKLCSEGKERHGRWLGLYLYQEYFNSVFDERSAQINR